MRALRSLTLLALLSTVAIGVAIADPAAQAQTVDESEQEAETAERQAEVAAGLVDTAVARRAEIEAELAVSITRISDLSAELSAVSSDLDRLKAQIAYGDAELTGIEADIEVHAIDAYMNALVGPGVSFVNTANVEQAMVTGQVVGDVVTAGAARVNELVVRRDALEGLQVEYREQQGRVATLKAEVDAEIEHLAALYDEADATVGRAVREASAADAAYRDALSAVDAAQAREEERRRQEERAPATTTPAASRRGRERAVHDYATTGDAGYHRRGWRRRWWRWGLGLPAGGGTMEITRPGVLPRESRRRGARRPAM